MENNEQQVKKSIPQIIFDSAIWTCILAYALITIGQIIGGIVYLLSGAQHTDLGTTAGLYFIFAGIWLVLFLNGLIKRNRSLFKAYGTGCKGNSALNLLIGYLIGIGMNGACILMAWMHGDIKLYFDRFEPIPFIILFIAVFIQSAAEEMVCPTPSSSWMLRQLRTASSTTSHSASKGRSRRSRSRSWCLS